MLAAQRALFYILLVGKQEDSTNMAYVVVSRISRPGDMIDIADAHINETMEQAVAKMNEEFDKIHSKYKSELPTSRFSRGSNAIIMDFFDAGYARVSIVKVDDDQLQGFTTAIRAFVSGL